MLWLEPRDECLRDHQVVDTVTVAAGRRRETA